MQIIHSFSPVFLIPWLISFNCLKIHPAAYQILSKKKLDKKQNTIILAEQPQISKGAGCPNNPLQWCSQGKTWIPSP